MEEDTQAYNKRLSRIIGGNLRRLRVRSGLNQSNLGALIGVSFQQVQKYERGTDRLSGVALYRLSQSLSCTPMEFYEGLDVVADRPSIVVEAPSLAEERFTQRFMASLLSIKDKKTLQLLLKLVESFAERVRP